MAVRSVKVKSGSTGAAKSSVSAVKAGKAPVKVVQASKKATQVRAGSMSIRVHCNVGLGNRITVRGDTDPFGWDGGVDGRNTAADVWEFHHERVPAGQTFQFKPLINDTTYSTGENYVGRGGETLDIYPAF